MTLLRLSTKEKIGRVTTMALFRSYEEKFDQINSV